MIRGLREWRFVLEPNDPGISYDLTFVDTTRQEFREPLSDTGHGTPPGNPPPPRPVPDRTPPRVPVGE